MAQLKGSWGVITRLASEHRVSRTFIYDLLATFKTECAALFLPPERMAPPTRESLEARILAYRFEGRCSIDAIATLMKREGLPLSSQGSVSEVLTRIGRALPDTLHTEQETTQLVVFANDEVYAKDQPILITVDPVSTAILKIELADNRTAEQWSQHYQALLANGFQPTLLTSDAGPGMVGANATTFPDIPWQLDTFHSVAHRLGDWDRRLEKRIDRALQHAINREETLASAKSDEVIDKRLISCFKADQALETASQLHANFRYLYREIIQQLNLFDTSGHLREQNAVKQTMEAALDLMDELAHNPMNQDIASVRKALPHCLTYFREAKAAVRRCEAITDCQGVLTALYLAWQWDKTRIKSKKSERRQHAIEQREAYLEWVQLLLDCPKKARELKEKVFHELDQIIQASSIVECINSLLRPYLNNSRNQVTQEFLNLFMFYHNHRRYRAGKRKGKTPLEILTGKAQEEDWITLLQAELKATEATFTA